MTKKFNKIVVKIDGGIGREICAIPALEKLAESYQVTVICGYPELFNGNPYIYRAYPLANRYLFEDVILNSDQFKYPEPYSNSAFYLQKRHLIECFNLELNGVLEFKKSNIYLTQTERSKAFEYVEKYIGNYKKIVAYQPFGSMFKPIKMDMGKFRNSDNPIAKNLLLLDRAVQYDDPSHRSLPFCLAKKIVFDKPEYLFLNFSSIKIDAPNILNIAEPLRSSLALIDQCHSFISVDSFLLHGASALGKTGYAILGASWPGNVSYPGCEVIQKAGWPKSVQTWRMGQDEQEIAKNEGAFDGLLLMEGLFE
jgi:hypothetical protein